MLAVTLAGKTAQRSQITIEGNGFSAVYETDDDTAVSQSVGVVFGQRDIWAIKGGSIGRRFVAPGPVNIRVAFILPEKVTTFHVRYPALAVGKATLQPSVAFRLKIATVSPPPLAVDKTPLSPATGFNRAGRLAVGL